ncbi:hypothetical protein DXF87_26520, partial [Enterobacter roggenkampii]
FFVFTGALQPFSVSTPMLPLFSLLRSHALPKPKPPRRRPPRPPPPPRPREQSRQPPPDPPPPVPPDDRPRSPAIN